MHCMVAIVTGFLEKIWCNDSMTFSVISVVNFTLISWNQTVFGKEFVKPVWGKWKLFRATLNPTRKTDNNIRSDCLRNIKQNRNWFYFKFSVESSSFNTLKQKNLSLLLKVETDQFVICLVLPECLSALHTRTAKRILTALMLSLLFRCFSLFLPQEER